MRVGGDITLNDFSQTTLPRKDREARVFDDALNINETATTPLGVAAKDDLSYLLQLLLGAFQISEAQASRFNGVKTALIIAFLVSSSICLPPTVQHLAGASSSSE